MDELELESTLFPRRSQFNLLDVLAEVAGNVRGSAGRGAPLVNGPATKLAAESNVGAAGVWMLLEADGGRGCRSRRSERSSVSPSAVQDAAEASSRWSSLKSNQLIDGPVTKLAAESNVGAAGVSMLLEADGGRSCRRHDRR